MQCSYCPTQQPGNCVLDQFHFASPPQRQPHMVGSHCGTISPDQERIRQVYQVKLVATSLGRSMVGFLACIVTRAVFLKHWLTAQMRPWAYFQESHESVWEIHLWWPVPRNLLREIHSWLSHFFAMHSESHKYIVCTVYNKNIKFTLSMRRGKNSHKALCLCCLVVIKL